MNRFHVRWTSVRWGEAATHIGSLMNFDILLLWFSLGRGKSWLVVIRTYRIDVKKEKWGRGGEEKFVFTRKINRKDVEGRSCFQSFPMRNVSSSSVQVRKSNVFSPEGLSLNGRRTGICTAEEEQKVIRVSDEGDDRFFSCLGTTKLSRKSFETCDTRRFLDLIAAFLT